MLTVLQYRCAVDQNMNHAGSILMRLFECGVIFDRQWIKHGDVCEVPGFQASSFDDLQVRHLKTSTSRIPTRTTRLDARNNLLVITRNFPRHWVPPFAIAWTRRYAWMAKSRGRAHQIAFGRGLVEGVFRSLISGKRKPVGLAAFETFACVVSIRRRLDQAVLQHRLQSIVLVDLGKNILPFIRAARASGLRITAIADNQLAAPGRTFNSIPIITDEQAHAMIFDAAVITNMSPADAGKRVRDWQNTGRLTIDLFGKTQPLAIAA